MISTLGNITLVCALLFAVLQSSLPLSGTWRKNVYALAVARPCAWGQFFAILCAYLLLTLAFYTNDFSLTYVAANSHPALPWFYRLTALWGAHEGSILLWILFLNAWTVYFSHRQKNLASLPLILAIVGCVSVCFLLFLIFTSNPFLAAPYPLQGQDLNPLLQDPGFIIHPPMLYAGYVGFVIPFAITQAALLQKKLDASWAMLTRQWTLAAWCFLTLGITLGSWWAYRVLGWGGFWFWDPVENASLLPWLMGTALLHSLVLFEKHAGSVRWSALLTIITFAFSLLGTFLVRSGILVSAHTFANDPARGIFLLLLLAIVATLALVNYVYPRHATLGMDPAVKPRDDSLGARDDSLIGLWGNTLLLFTAAMTVLIGTLYPLIAETLKLGAISVGAPYFNLVMTPILFLLLILMGFAPYRDLHHRKLWFSLLRKIVVCLLGGIFLPWFFSGTIDFLTSLLLALSFWVLINLPIAMRQIPAMTIAHLGFVILILGITLSSAFSEEREVRIQPQENTRLGPYVFHFLGTDEIQGENYKSIRAHFLVKKNQRIITDLTPEKRFYLVRDMIMTKVDIHPGIFRDLYIALGEPLDKTAWSVRLYYKPFIRWVWSGGVLMTLGGLLALWQRRQKSL